MARMFAIHIDSIDLTKLADIPEKATEAARMAINKASKRAVSVGRDSMQHQVAFPGGYLSGKSKSGPRFGITAPATNQKLQAIVRGRDDATSLARFVVGGPASRPKASGQKQVRGVTVMVDPGRPKSMPNAFVIKLANGNLGLAYFDTSGRGPKNTIGARRLSKSVWLLYGPSVSQVWDETRDEIKDDIANLMEKEYLRLLKVNI